MTARAILHTTVLGGGAMGTALAVIASELDSARVALWMRDSDHAATVRALRENRRLLPGVTIPDRVLITTEIREAVARTDLLILAIPTQFVRKSLTELAAHIPPAIPVVSAVKGIEIGTGLRPSEIILEVLGPRPVAVLGGPSHAEEFARRLPCSVVAACPDEAFARSVQHRLTTPRFRVYTSTDRLGVELAGAIKNIIGIAAGICDGLGYGDNAVSALITRGIVEISRFGVACGAQPATFAGLAGIGDLVASCTSQHGRNRQVGERLGRGEALPAILSSMNAIAEGVTTTQSVFALSCEREIEMPIVAEVHAVLFEGKSPTEATNSLMLRPPRGE